MDVRTSGRWSTAVWDGGLRLMREQIVNPCSAVQLGCLWGLRGAFVGPAAGAAHPGGAKCPPQPQRR